MGRRTGLVAAAALLAISACSGGDDSTVDDDGVAPASTATAASEDSASTPNADTTADPASDLECERNGYPCSIAQVPAEVLRRSRDLATDANRRLDDGATMAEVADWLSGLDDVVEVEGDAGAVWFRVAGGNGLWLLGDGLEGSRSAPAAVDVAAAAPPPAGAFTARPPDSEHVVAPGEEIKRALVLAPVLYQFANTDDAPVVANILQGTEDYAGNVDYQGNDTVTSTDVTLDDFETWDDYDIVHVSTHGKRICAQEPCRGMIVAGPLDAVLPSGPGDQIDKIAGLDFLDRPGVGVSIGRSGNGYVVLSADFFRAVYPGGLVDTFVFFNACQTLGSGQTDIAEAITGTSSVFVGWSEVVASLQALDAADALYTDMAERGVTADVAFAELDADMTVGEPYKDHDPPVLQLLDRADGDHLRIREVVELLQPGTHDPVEFSEIPIDGTIGDGKPDAVPYRVRVDGHDELQAAAGVLHVSIDGVEASPRAVDEGSPDGQGRWTVDGDIELGYDLDTERDVELRAWVELPDGGESFDVETATLTGEPLMGTRWEMTATHNAVFTNLPATPAIETGTLTFVFAEGQAKDEPHPRYVLEGGSVHVDLNHTYGDCVYTAPTFSYEVDPHDFYGIEFDTTSSPVRYRAYVETQSPWFTRVDDCGDGPTPREHRVLTSWIDLRDEPKPITDATTIVGSQEHQDGCCFVRRSEYEIRRVD
jgi:hypothetical protein